LFFFSSSGCDSIKGTELKGGLKRVKNLLLGPCLSGEKKTDEIRWYKDNSVIMKLKNNDITNYMKKEAYNMSQNGTLQIHRLVKEDSGNYKVQVYNVEGKLKMEKNFHLIIQDHVSKPKITWTCSKKTVKVICEVNQTDKASIHLLQNNKAVPGNKPASANGKLKIEFTYRNTTFPAKFQCEVKNDADKKTVEQEIRCSELGSLDIVLILSIAGGAVFFVIFLALLIYCIRKKRAERYDEEALLRTIIYQLVSEPLGHSVPTLNHIWPLVFQKWEPPDVPPKIRDELPQVPAHAPQRQPRQQQRPAPQPHPPHQAKLPQPRPRTQPKSPSHMKERQ
uniref:CD2 molecule n=1 Tax=Pelodiscus sinensis TaxID=13735 RepID=K7FTM7_PELSI